MMEALNESHVKHLHLDFQDRFWQTELDGMNGFAFGNHRPIATIKQVKIARINSLLLEQRKAELGQVTWPSESINV